MTEQQAEKIIYQLSAIVDLLARQQGMTIEWDPIQQMFVEVVSRNGALLSYVGNRRGNREAIHANPSNK